MIKNKVRFCRIVAYRMLLLLAGFILEGCEAERDFLDESQRGTINVLKIEQVPFLIPSIQEFNHGYDYLTNPNIKDSNVTNSILNLDLENIIEYVYGNGLKTYSIRINNTFEVNDDKFFENLHIYQKNQEYKSFVLKYNAIDDTIPFNTDTFTGAIDIYSTDYVYQGIIQFENGARRHTKIIIGCWHIWFHNGTIDVWESEGCSDTPSGSSQSNNDATSFLYIAAPPINLESNGGGDNTRLTEPCQKLKDLANPAIGNIKPEIDFLKDKVENDATNNSEWSFTIKKTMNSDETYTYTKTFEQGAEFETGITTSGLHIGGGHNHPANGYDIPSWGDVKALRDSYNEASDTRKSDVVIMTVCKDDYTDEKLVYAMYVYDFNMLNLAVNRVWNNQKYSVIDNEKDRLYKINNDMKEIYDANKQNLEKIFLQQFNLYGISLFKATNQDLTDWEKLELNTDPTQLIGNQLSVQRIPCN